MNRKLWGALAAPVVSVLALSGCGSSSASSPATTGAPTASQQATAQSGASGAIAFPAVTDDGTGMVPQPSKDCPSVNPDIDWMGGMKPSDAPSGPQTPNFGDDGNVTANVETMKPADMKKFMEHFCQIDQTIKTLQISAIDEKIDIMGGVYQPQEHPSDVNSASSDDSVDRLTMNVDRTTRRGYITTYAAGTDSSGTSSMSTTLEHQPNMTVATRSDGSTPQGLASTEMGTQPSTPFDSTIQEQVLNLQYAADPYQMVELALDYDMSYGNGTELRHVTVNNVTSDTFELADEATDKVLVFTTDKANGHITNFYMTETAPTGDNDSVHTLVYNVDGEDGGFAFPQLNNPITVPNDDIQNPVTDEPMLKH